MLRMLLMILCVCNAAIAHAQGNVTLLPDKTQGSFEFSGRMMYYPLNPVWYPTLQAACEGHAAYLASIRSDFAGAYCVKSYVVPANYSGYWFMSIAFPNWHLWSGELAVVTEPSVNVRVACPSGYGGGSFEWDITTTPRSMVAVCGRTAFCPANATGKPVNYPTTCACNEGYAPDATATSCLPANYTVTLTPDRPGTEPSQSLGFTATVKNKSDEFPPKEDVEIKISLTVDDKSGGHDHGDSTRSRGSLGSKACTTDDTCVTLIAKADNGIVTFDFNPTDASGKHTITASCDKCSGGNDNTKTVEVKVEGLIEIPASQFYIFGPSSRHGTKNHYLMPAAAEKLLLLAINYQSQGQFKVMNPNTNTMVWPEPFRVNDASLEWGGRFDIFGDWTNPHIEHRRGTTVDLRANEGTPNAIPPENFEGFEMLLTNINGGEEGGFIRECTKDKKDTNGNLIPPIHKRMASNYCVSQLDGSFDDNRHYHVRLMGVAE